MSGNNGKNWKAPRHLRAATRRWVDGVVENYVLEPHHLRLLVLAGEAWDRCTAAREAIAENGLTCEGRFGAKARPEVAIERDSRLAFARLVRELNLDADPPDENRPPGLRYGG